MYPPALTVPDLARFWRSMSRSEVAEVSRLCSRCKGVAGKVEGDACSCRRSLV